MVKDPLSPSWSAFKIGLGYPLYREPTLNVHAGPKRFSGLAVPSGRPPLCPHGIPFPTDLLPHPRAPGVQHRARNSEGTQ